MPTSLNERSIKRNKATGQDRVSSSQEVIHSPVWIGPNGKPRNEEITVSRLKSIE